MMGKIFCEGRKAEDLRFQEAIVSSAHHQAVNDVAPGFQATARSADGMVEAIESTNPNWFALGVQFHPHAALATHVEHLVFDAWVETVQRIALANAAPQGGVRARRTTAHASCRCAKPSKERPACLAPPFVGFIWTYTRRSVSYEPWLAYAAAGRHGWPRAAALLNSEFEL